LLIKRGDAEARNVRAKVRYGDDEQIVERENVAVDGESLVFVFHDALADYQMEYAEREQRNHMASTMGWSAASISAGGINTHPVNERIEWVTPLGVPNLRTERKLTTFSVYFRHR
jgi:hypothetical protein